MAIIAVAISVISYFLLDRLYGGGNEPAIISACMAIIFFLVSNKIIMDKDAKKSKNDENEKLLAEIKKRATFEYVDTQDEHMINLFEQHLDESRSSDKKVMDLVTSMDRKLDILIGKR